MDEDMKNQELSGSVNDMESAAGEIVQATPETVIYDPAQVMRALEKTNLSDETRIFKGINIPEEPEIQVKTVDVGKFNTIDLQKALANAVREVVGGSETVTEAQKAEFHKMFPLVWGHGTDELHALMVLKDGKVIYEETDPAHTIDEKHVLWSASKTFTATAVGFAVQQIKRRWYVEEMNQLVFVAELLKEKHSGQ